MPAGGLVVFSISANVVFVGGVFLSARGVANALMDIAMLQLALCFSW